MNAINYEKGQGDFKDWLIEESQFDTRHLGKFEAIFAQGNGYLGIRNALEERYVEETRDTFITGTFNKAGEDEVTELPNIPDVTAMDILVDGYRFNLEAGGLEAYSRVLNLKNGETVRNVTWKCPSGVTVTAVFKRMVSRSNEHVLASLCSLTCDRDAKIVIETGIHGDVTNQGAMHFKNLRRRVHDGVYMQLLAETTESGVWAAVHSACRLNKEVKALPVMGRRNLDLRYTIELPAGEELRLEKITAVHSSRDLAYEKNEAGFDMAETLKCDGMACLKEAFEKGYDILLSESEREWAKFWEDQGVVIEGDAGIYQLAMRFAQYHLEIMVKKDDNRVGIGAKALTGEGYKGHSFWDTEMFILPYFTLTDPETARTLLEYRYRNLYGAHKKARENGWKGAMYPWECAWIDDGEVTPLYLGADVVTGKVQKCLTGLIEHHISADVAYAVWQYYESTGDVDYMEKYGYEIILDTALFWADRLEYNKELDRYEINDVIGPDEYKEHVDNNAYTNYMADYNMALAERVMETLKEQGGKTAERLDEQFHFGELESLLAERRAKLYLPKPNGEGIVPQTDQYLGLTPLDLTKYKTSGTVLGIHNDYNMEQLGKLMVSKQADTVMLDFVLPDLFPQEVKEKNFDFYEDKTLHDSSLSRCVHTVLANDYGKTEMAMKLYNGACMTDLGPNMKSSDEGIHSASIGGIWLATVMGFGGVRIRHGKLVINPALPEGWKSLQFVLYWQGERLVVKAGTDSVEVRNEGNAPVTVTVREQEITVCPNQGCNENWSENCQENCQESCPENCQESSQEGKRKYRGIIFDLDGVICHTDQYHYQAWKSVADELGIYFDEVINNRLRGVSRKESFEIILERYDGVMDEETKLHYLEKKNDLYRQLLERMTEDDLDKETKRTLEELRAENFLLAIGSSSKNAGLILNHLGLGEFFDAVSDGNVITHSKPHPEVFLKAAAMLGLEAGECLVVEDAVAGLQAAKAGGMDCAAIGDARDSELADYRLDTFADLLTSVR